MIKLQLQVQSLLLQAESSVSAEIGFSTCPFVPSLASRPDDRRRGDQDSYLHCRSAAECTSVVDPIQHKICLKISPEFFNTEFIRPNRIHQQTHWHLFEQLASRV